MKLIRMMCPQSKWGIKCPYKMNSDGIIVHNTANKASAKSEISYMIGNDYEVSYHWAVDDKYIVQGIEEDRNTWNAGDGSNGKGNRKRLSLEICYSTGNLEQFKNAEKLAAKFIAMKLKEKGWGIDKVSKHQDYSGKYCPHKTLDLGWQRFLDIIRKELGQPEEDITKPLPEPKPEIGYTGVITYQAYTDEWLPEVFKADNTGSGYAGMFGRPIDGFRCKPQYGDITYEAHQLGGKWLGAVNSKDYKKNDLKSINSYAGIYGKKLDGIRIKSSKGYVDYRVHTIEDGWLPWARGFGDSGNKYAGIYGHTIDGIQMK